MPQPLSSKEKSLFRHLVEDYEAKQYKKGLKAADQILKKNPKHADTQAMKALILNSLGQGDEAFALAKESLRNDMKSQVCWHVYGLLWRSVRNYEEAIKAYRFALRFEPESAQVLRDLALLQAQMRDYQGYVGSRNLMLQARPGARQNWTALAVAHHLAGDLKAAEHVLDAYEKTLKITPPRTDYEHYEAALYKNTVIAEQGETERALEHLESIAPTSLDKLFVLETRAKYLLELDRKDDAEKAYRALIERNPENRSYYKGLEKSLDLDSTKKTDLKELYGSLAQRHDRIDAARRIPLDFLDGPDFKEFADKYLQAKLQKGVPSTFNNVKSLYADSSKLQTIQNLVESYKDTAESTENTEEKRKSFKEAVYYFLAQHYNYKLSRNLELAKKYTEELIKTYPKTYDYLMMRARIQKHSGDPAGAAKTMNEARELDLKDRYINTKCAKYQLRNDENEAALQTMSKFTRNEVVGGTLGDLIDMQSTWFLTEDGEAYARRGNLGLALKRFQTVFDIFETWQEDQFDFHSFSFRKGQIRAYIEMMRWEDHVRDHPFYTRIAIDAAKIYIRLHDKPQLAKEDYLNGINGDDPKAARKAKKEAERREREEEEKREAERKAAAAKKATASSDGEQKKPDPDPRGKQLLETKDPLGQAAKFVAPLMEFAADNLEAQHIGFEVFIRRQKYLLALKCLLAAFALDADDAIAHSQTIRFRQLVKPSDDNKTVLDLANSSLPKPYNDPSSALAGVNDAFLASHPNSASHAYAFIRTRAFLDESAEAKRKNEESVLQTLDACKDATVKDRLDGIELLKELGASKDVIQKFAQGAKQQFPDASILDREAGR